MTSPVAPIHQNNLMSKSPLEVWKIDIVGPFTTVDKQKVYILVGVCTLTKYAFFTELLNLTVEKGLRAI